MKKLSLLLVVLSLFTVLGAQTKSLKKTDPLTVADPASAGMSAERLSRIDKVCEQQINNGNLPGMVVLVARNGKIVYNKAFGIADPEKNRKYKTDDIFRIASQSKGITATAVMMLWEEGKFQLDDPISKYIPEFENPQVLATFNEKDTTYTTVPADTVITIRNLLTHTSGLGYGVIDEDERFKMIYEKAGIVDLYTTKDVKIGDNVKKLARLPLHHNPGEKFTYCEGLDVMGYFVEIMSGMPFDQFLRTRLFDPLGMNDTWFYLPDSKADRLVPVQHKPDGKWENYPVTFYDPDYPIKGAKTFFSGGAGLSSTAKDYATFLQMYLNKGELNGIRILSRKTVEFMMANQIDGLWGLASDSYYGLAFGITTQMGQDMGGKGSIGSFGWGGYFNTQYFADPKENLIGIIMKQTSGKVPAEDTAWNFRTLAEQAIDD